MRNLPHFQHAPLDCSALIIAVLLLQVVFRASNVDLCHMHSPCTFVAGLLHATHTHRRKMSAISSTKRA